MKSHYLSTNKSPPHRKKRTPCGYIIFKTGESSFSVFTASFASFYVLSSKVLHLQLLLLRFHYAGWCFDYPGLICIQLCTEAEFLDENLSLKSFPPCYSQSPLQLCLVILNFFKLTQPLTDFFKLTQLLTYSTVQLLYTVQEKEGKPYRNHTPLPPSW